jgi:hypothetical protein
MKKLGFATFVALIAVFVLVIGGQGSAGGHKHKVTADLLTGYQETPSVSSPTASGTFSATIDDSAQVITYRLTFVGLSGPAIQSHVHFGSRFTAGGVSFFLCGGGTKPPCPPGTTTEAVVTGTVTPADVIGPAGQGIAPGEWKEIVAAMRAGVAYANVHSPMFPAGEIRGQINDEDQNGDHGDQNGD